MSKIESSRLKRWKGEYDFAVDGGAVSTITLRSNDGEIPNGAVVLSGYLKVRTALTSSGSATGALQAEAANDIVSQAAYSGAPWSSTGRKSIIPVFTGATTVETTAARNPAFLIGTAALTAGKFELVLFYSDHNA
jgi:hypothetical protein